MSKIDKKHKTKRNKVKCQSLGKINETEELLTILIKTKIEVQIKLEMKEKHNYKYRKGYISLKNICTTLCQ